MFQISRVAVMKGAAERLTASVNTRYNGIFALKHGFQALTLSGPLYFPRGKKASTVRFVYFDPFLIHRSVRPILHPPTMPCAVYHWRGICTQFLDLLAGNRLGYIEMLVTELNCPLRKVFTLSTLTYSTNSHHGQ